MIFDKNRRRVKYCPCGKKNDDGKFAPYKGYEDKGHCHSCGETFHLEKANSEEWKISQYQSIMKPERNPDLIPEQVFIKLRKEGDNHKNHFIEWMASSGRIEYAFDSETIAKLIEKYLLATYRSNWILFPYIDFDGNIRDIKAMDYNPSTGKRIAVKNGDESDRCYFLGKKILTDQGVSEPNLKLCFYGEQLLNGNDKDAMIFESEATATYAAVFYPDAVCIATGGKNGCKWTDKAVFNVLKGRNVILYPDIDAHEEWEKKAEILRFSGIDVSVAGVIKNHALRLSQQHQIDISEFIKQKFDLRDILKFKKPPTPKTNPEPKIEVKPIQVVKPSPTAEDITFSKMAAKCPNLEQFASAIDLVSLKTGKPFQIVPIEEAEEQSDPPIEPIQGSYEKEPNEEAIRKLDAIAGRILMLKQSYTAEEVQQLMKATLKISSDRAKAGTQKMIAFEVIQPTWNFRYYLRDSTPF